MSAKIAEQNLYDMGQINELARRVHASALKRKKIRKCSCYDDILYDLIREVEEAQEAFEIGEKNISDEWQKPKYEVADIILVALTLAVQQGIDIEKALYEKMIYNEIRMD